jgi:hypothetical protein
VFYLQLFFKLHTILIYVVVRLKVRYVQIKSNHIHEFTSYIVDHLPKFVGKTSNFGGSPSPANFSTPSTSLQRLIRLERVNRRERFSMKKPLRSSARGASFHTKHASNVNAIETY